MGPLLLLPIFAISTVLSPIALAQAHPELVVGCDSTGKLVATFDATKPHPLPASRFDGIEGYADAMPGFMSVFVAKPAEDLFPADPQSKLVFVLVDADAGITVWNDHGTAPMKPGDTFSLGNPPFDSHPVWNLVTGEAGKSYGLRLKLRDTTGRHKESDVFSPTFTPDDATAVFQCPMKCKGGPIYRDAGKCPVCEMRLKLVSARSYRVSVTPETSPAGDAKIRAGVETALRFRLESPDGTPVSDLEVVHEKLIHLLMVSADLSWFAHEHPEIQPDGTFLLKYTFPYGGRFVLYHDFTPQRAGMQVVPVELDVAGDTPAAIPLTVSTDRVVQVDGYTARLRATSPLKTIQMQSLTVQISRDGKPVTDLEPFLGAMGHLIVISRDRKHFVHSHPLETSKSATDATRHAGPEIVFSAQFTAPGVYKAWSQFQHHGQVITAPFVIEVVAAR